MKKTVLLALAAVALLYAYNLWQAAQPFAGVWPTPPGPKAEAERLERLVTELVARFPHRHGGNPAELNASGAWLESLLASQGLGPVRQPLSANGQDYFNLLVETGPTKGAEGATGPALVVGAHYDAHPETPGADDNGSGVAALVELARLLAAAPPSCRVQLALWTLEEPPYFRTAQMGSAHHARQLRSSGARLRFAVSVEMVGYFSEASASQRYPPAFPFRLAYPSRGDFALLLGDTSARGATRLLKAAFAGASALPLESVNVSRTLRGADFSDHLNFWNEGYPAFMLTDTAFLRNDHYHRATDVPATLDFARMAQLVDGLWAMVQDGCSSRHQLAP